jgi:hypothetical protein
MKYTRRRFLSGALAAPLAGPLAAQLGGASTSGIAAPLGLLSAPQSQPQFENPDIIRYDAQCFTLNRRDTFVRSAAFHYPRCPEELWMDRLTKIKRAGFNTVESYVFWNYHEPVEGRADLAEFERFVAAVHKMGLWMITRPGPYVCAEWDAGGFPHWIIARQFPLRSDDPQSVRTSQHWYSQVLPVIQRNQITTGGPIILIQIENEYDFWLLPAAQKKALITALAEMVWNAGIDIPIITNLCKEARDNSDPVMARIMDTADFYPGWNFVRETLGSLAQLRTQEPDSPLGITELQGGWFSNFGGKLSVDQPGVDGAQLNALTKTMIEHGVTYYSYYMGFGGTNFDWAGKNITTTYDYAAPIREPGGLWEKYYAARAICSTIRQFEPLLVRAKPAPGPKSTNPKVSVTQRVNGKSGFVFVRENSGSPQTFSMSFPDPNSPTQRVITIPREGKLSLAGRNMKLLPVQIPLTGGQIRYTTAEVLEAGANVDRPYVIVYDDPGSLVEISLATEVEPQVEGETNYQYWDSPFESVVIGFTMPEQRKMLLLNNRFQVIALPREQAMRTWTARYPVHVVPGTEGTGDMQVPFITDAALMGDSGWEKKHHAWADLYFKEGTHQVEVMWPLNPDRCRVDGATTATNYADRWRTVHFEITTPSSPAQPVTPGNAEFWTERFAPSLGEWQTSGLVPLTTLGEIPYGYVKYRAELAATSPSKMWLTAFDDDGRAVFINGKHVPEASHPALKSEFDVSPYLASGSNTLEIAYGLFGAYNFGPQIARLQGIESVRVGPDPDHAVAIDHWQIQRIPAAMHGRKIDPNYSGEQWQPAPTGGTTTSQLLPAFCWVRTVFEMPELPEEWSIVWNATIEAERDALLYLNGKFVGRYVTEGPQTEFYLPEPWLQFGKKSQNVLSIALALTDQPAALRSLQVAPYKEFTTRRTRVEFEWAG